MTGRAGPAPIRHHRGVRRAAAVSVAIWLGGCGLLLDPALEPDAATAPDGSGGRRDAGARDAGARRDAGVDADAAGLDAGGADAGAPDAGPADAVLDGGPTPVADCEETCPNGFYCRRRTGVCLGPASCVPLPSDDCPAVFDPVCGCDRNEYSSPCHAAAAGVDVAVAGECPAYDDNTFCALAPPASPMTACFPCYTSEDCFEAGLSATYCVGVVACTPDGWGRCSFVPPVGSCYYDSDCRDGERCEGERLLSCDEGPASIMGSCVTRAF